MASVRVVLLRIINAQCRAFRRRVPGGRANHITHRIVHCASRALRHPCILYILPSDPVCIPGCTRCVPLGQPLLGARGSLGHVAQEPGREPGNIHTCSDRAEQNFYHHSLYVCMDARIVMRGPSVLDSNGDGPGLNCAVL